MEGFLLRLYLSWTSHSSTGGKPRPDENSLDKVRVATIESILLKSMFLVFPSKAKDEGTFGWESSRREGSHFRIAIPLAGPPAPVRVLAYY